MEKVNGKWKEYKFNGDIISKREYLNGVLIKNINKNNNSDDEKNN